MGNYLKKSISKPFILSVAVTALILICFAVAFIARTYLMSNKAKIEEGIRNYLKHPVTISQVRYIPPLFIVLEDVVIKAKTHEQEDLPLYVKKIVITFSLGEYLSKKNFQVSQVIFNAPHVDFYKYPLFIRENIEGIVSLLGILARGQSLKIIVNEGKVVFEKKGNREKFISLDSRIQTSSKKKIYGSGTIDIFEEIKEASSQTRKRLLLEEPLDYSFENVVFEEGIQIRDLCFRAGDFSADFRGKFDTNTLSLKGFSIIENFYDTGGIKGKPNNELVEKFKNLVMYKRLPQRIGASQESLNIFDIDCLIGFTSQQLIIEKVKCNVNNIPVRFSGDINFLEQPKVDFKLSTYPDSPALERQKNPKMIDVILSYISDKNNFSGSIEVHFVKATFKKMSLQILKAAFKDLSFGFTPDTRFKCFVDSLRLRYASGEEVYDFSLNSFEALFNFLENQIKAVKFNSRLYDGHLDGHAKLNVASDPLELSSHLKVQGVNANELETVLLSLFAPYRKLHTKIEGRVEGKFACELDYKNHPQVQMIGKIGITDGSLENVGFFVWLSDFLGLPELKQIAFSDISAEFLVTDTVATLEKIKIEADQVAVDGFFKLEENDFVSSKLSILLAEKLLKKSAKFTLLLALIDKEADALSFDFQLSGVFNSVNFKWLESEFKGKLKKLLPGFVERGIENKIERAIGIISAPKK